MNKVICLSIGGQLISSLPFIRFIMNICYVTELGIGNPSRSVCLNDLFTKAKTEFLFAAYSPRQYYSSSQTFVLTTGKAWLLRSFIRT